MDMDCINHSSVSAFRYPSASRKLVGGIDVSDASDLSTQAFAHSQPTGNDGRTTDQFEAYEVKYSSDPSFREIFCLFPSPIIQISISLT